MTLQLFSILVLGLMAGSELNIAAFAHPRSTANRWKSTYHTFMVSYIIRPRNAILDERVPLC